MNLFIAGDVSFLDLIQMFKL